MTGTGETMNRLIREMQDYGLIIKGDLNLNGDWQRVPTIEKPGNDNGWYIGKAGESVTYGDWQRDGDHRTFFPNGKTELSKQDHELIRQRIEQERQKRESLNKQTAVRAKSLWDNATECPSDYEYLTRKNVKPQGYRAEAETGTMLVPMYDENYQLWNIQRILPDGKKVFLKNGRVSGCFFAIEGDKSRYFICEGFATGATIHDATGSTVLVAFNAGNLHHVTQAIRRVRADVPITICADNDHNTDGNPGISKGKSVAMAFGVDVVWPEGIEGTDFNDMANEIGIDAVRKSVYGTGVENATAAEDHETLADRLVYVESGNLVADLSKSPQNSILKMEEAKNSFKNLPMIKQGQNYVHALTNWMSDENRKTARGIGYKPGGPRLYEDQGELWVNTFYMPKWNKPAGIDKIDILQNHLKLIVPNDDDRQLFLQWLAATVHQPQYRSGFTPLLVSSQQGLGRGWLVKLIEAIVGTWNVSHVKLKALAGQSNDGQYHDYLHRKIFCSVPEVKVGQGRFDIDDEIRDKLTDSPLNLNLKYGQNGTFEIYTNFMMATNSRDALVISSEDRRIFVTESNETKPGPKYFKKIYATLNDQDFLAQVFYWLKDLQKPDYYVQQSAPMNRAKRVMINMARSDLEQMLFDMIQDREAVADLITSADLRTYAENQGYQWDEDSDKGRVQSIFRQHALPVNDGKKLRVKTGGYPVMVYAIRNPGKWIHKNTDEIKTEYNRLK